MDTTIKEQSRKFIAAKIACDEHALWGRPFINAAGHLTQIGPMEGETDKLANGESAWQRVLHYWTAGVGAEYLYNPDDVSPDAPQTVKNAWVLGSKRIKLCANLLRPNEKQVLQAFKN